MLSSAIIIKLDYHAKHMRSNRHILRIHSCRTVSFLATSPLENRRNTRKDIKTPPSNPDHFPIENLNADQRTKGILLYSSSAPRCASVSISVGLTVARRVSLMSLAIGKREIGSGTGLVHYSLSFEVTAHSQQTRLSYARSTRRLPYCHSSADATFGLHSAPGRKRSPIIDKH